MIYRKGAITTLVAAALVVGSLAGASSIERVLAAASGVPNVSCASSSPCQSNSNAGSGPGAASSSAGGSGLTGTTTLVSTSSINGSGVLGTDASTSGGADSGVKGVSKFGTGVFGSSKNGNGVRGTSTKGSGVVGTTASPTLAAIVGTSTGSTGIGINGTGPLVGVEGTGFVGVLGVESGLGTALQLNGDGSGGDLILGRAGFSTVYSVDESGNEFPAGVFTSGEVSSGLLVARAGAANVGIDGIGDSNSYASIEADSNVAPGYLYDGFDPSFSAVYTVDTSGNIHIAGQIFTAGSCSSGCLHTRSGGNRVVSYTPRESQPTMEDFGSAQLTRGHAHVALSSDFANVINRGAGYLVFLTPDGDCNGLYVMDKTAQGFDVGELRGGMSNIAFDFRIVAKPFGDRSARLPMVDMRTVRPAVTARHAHI